MVFLHLLLFGILANFYCFVYLGVFYVFFYYAFLYFIVFKLSGHASVSSHIGPAFVPFDISLCQ